MKHLAISLALAAALTTPAFAQDDDSQHNLANQPDYVPGTTHAWPADDKACDQAFLDRDAELVVKLCQKSVDEYSTLVLAVIAEPQNIANNEPPELIRELTYDEAYTEGVELSQALNHLGKKDEALAKLKNAQTLAKTIIVKAALTDLDSSFNQKANDLLEDFSDLQNSYEGKSNT